MPEPVDASVFESIFQKRVWGSDESMSGHGSTLAKTAVLRGRLKAAFGHFGIRSLVDAPCGDMNWMRTLDFKFEKFIGIDIVPVLIEKLRLEAFDSIYHFQVGNVVTDILPCYDAIFCRDCLVHLPFAAVHEAYRLWKIAGFKFAFVTTFPDRRTNSDCGTGEWRPLNMEAAPFHWPRPLMMLREDHEPPYEDKSVGVWAL